MATANIRAVITAEDRASTTLAGFSKKVEGVGNKIQKSLKVAAAVGTAVIGVSLVKSIDSAIKRLDTLNNSARTFENMGFTAQEVSKSMKALEKSILGLPTPLDSAVRNMITITASINDIGKGQEVFTALNNAILGFGGTTEMVDNAVLQLSQDMGTGRITARTWLSMMNSGLTPALAAMSRQMGVTTQELKDGLSNGTISVDKFLDSLINMNKKGGGGLKSFEQISKDSAKGIQSSIANMNTAIARGLVKLLDAIGRENITKLITGFGNAVESSMEFLIEFGRKAVEVGRSISEYLAPKLEALWNNIKEELIPILKDLWKNVIEPLIPVIGTALVVALGLALDAFNAIIEALGWLHQAIKDGNPIILALIGLFGTLALAMAMNATFTALTNAFNTLRNTTIPRVITRMTALKTLVTTPMIMPAIAVAAAIIAIWKVIDAYKVLQREKAAAEGAINDFRKSKRSFYDSLEQGVLQGKFSAKEAARRRKAYEAGLPSHLRNASGTDFFRGGMSLVGERGPEIVSLPRGAKVHPNDKTQKMMGSGNTVNVNVNIGLYSGSEREKRKVAQELFKSLKDVASSQNLTMQQMLGQ